MFHLILPFIFDQLTALHCDWSINSSRCLVIGPLAAPTPLCQLTLLHCDWSISSSHPLCQPTALHYVWSISSFHPLSQLTLLHCDRSISSSLSVSWHCCIVIGPLASPTPFSQLTLMDCDWSISSSHPSVSWHCCIVVWISGFWRFYYQANMRLFSIYTMSFCNANLPRDQPPDTSNSSSFTRSE